MCESEVVLFEEGCVHVHAGKPREDLAQAVSERRRHRPWKAFSFCLPYRCPLLWAYLCVERLLVH